MADKERQLEFDRHQTQLLAELRAQLRELERMVGHPSDSHGGFVLAVAA